MQPIAVVDPLSCVLALDLRQSGNVARFVRQHPHPYGSTTGEAPLVIQVRRVRMAPRTGSPVVPSGTRLYGIDSGIKSMQYATVATPSDLLITYRCVCAVPYFRTARMQAVLAGEARSPMLYYLGLYAAMDVPAGQELTCDFSSVQSISASWA